jgi:hypothetical protein
MGWLAGSRRGSDPSILTVHRCGKVPSGCCTDKMVGRSSCVGRSSSETRPSCRKTLQPPHASAVVHAKYSPSKNLRKITACGNARRDYLVERVGSYDRQNMALSIRLNRRARWKISLPVPERGEALDKSRMTDRDSQSQYLHAPCGVIAHVLIPRASPVPCSAPMSASHREFINQRRAPDRQHRTDPPHRTTATHSRAGSVPLRCSLEICQS